MTCERDGHARGLVTWFETKLLDEIGFSNAPGKPPVIYGMQYFPLLQSTYVSAGDQIEVSLAASLHEQDYLWQWETRIYHAQTDRLRAEFKQSIFHSSPLTLKELQKGSDRHVPQLDKEGCIDHFIMSQMQGRQTLGEIAAKLIAEFPDLLNSFQAALNRVAAVSKRYSS